MPYCIHCGVKLNHRYNNCPLCQIKVEFPTRRRESKPLYPTEINKISIIKSHANARDWITIHFLGFIILLAFLLTTGLNLYLNGKLTWSLISSISFVFIYITVTAILHLKRNPILLYAYINGLIGLYLFGLDILTFGGSWFIKYALPCFISLQLFSLAIKILFRYIKNKLLRAVTIILLTNAFLIVINEFTTHKVSWTLLTSSILLPTALYLIFLSKTLKLKESYPLTT